MPSLRDMLTLEAAEVADLLVDRSNGSLTLPSAVSQIIEQWGREHGYAAPPARHQQFSDGIPSRPPGTTEDVSGTRAAGRAL